MKTLEINQATFKDKNGRTRKMNALVDRSTEQSLKEIEDKKKAVLDAIPDDYEALAADVASTRQDLNHKADKSEIDSIKTLLAQVRDALNRGDIDEAKNLLDTFLLGEGVLS